MKKTHTAHLLAIVLSLLMVELAAPAAAQLRPVATPMPRITPYATAPAVAPRVTSTPPPTPSPLPTISSRDATPTDVAMCTSLAAGIAALAWNAGTIGSAASWANTTVAELINMNPNTLAGLQLIAGALGYNTLPDDWMQLSLEALFSQTLKPGWDSCKLIVENFTSLPATFQILTAEPNFWVPRPNDSPGVAMGRTCAEEWRNGRRAVSLQGCNIGCEENLPNPSRQISCKAVCQAQFGTTQIRGLR